MADQEGLETSETAAQTGTSETASEEKAFSFVEDPTFDIDYKQNCAYEVKVTIPTVNEAKQAEELFDELSREAELPGFRRGRAPRSR